MTWSVNQNGSKNGRFVVQGYPYDNTLIHYGVNIQSKDNGLAHYGVNIQSKGNGLTHYGVKGMRWGVRKDKPTSTGTTSNDSSSSKLKAVARKAVDKTLDIFEETLGFTIEELDSKETFKEKGKYIAEKMLKIDNIALMVVAGVLPGVGYPMLLAGKAAIMQGMKKRNSGDKPMNELKHYGILGMKWGVRRTPEQLGHHTIKKGTKVYRTSGVPDESDLSGSTYVTYLPPDRDLYRGAWTDAIRKNYGLEKGDRLFETQYRLKEDLNIPSREEQTEVVNMLRSEGGSKEIKRIVEAEIEMLKKRNSLPDEEQYNEAREYVNYVFGTKSNTYEGFTKDLTKKYIDDYKEMNADQFFRSVSSRFGVDAVSKEKVIAELSKRGYNAMVDQASVGGGTRPREGVDPLIIFDRNKVLEPIKTKKLSAYAEALAAERYSDWSRRANSREVSKNPW